MRIENRIRKSETKEAQNLCCSNKGCSSPRAYNILASAQQSVVRSTKCPCIFQNVSSTFARFIGEAKGDIRISQLNTVISHLFYINHIFCARINVDIVLPTTHPPQAVPLLSQEKAIRNKKCLAFARHCIY